MDAPAAAAPAFKVNHFLPYAAVFSADVRQTLRSWIYRLWAFLSIAAVAGYLLYRFGAKNVGGVFQPAPELVHDLITWIIWGSVTLIIVLTASAISGERDTFGDAVLCRGISRTQYFLGKWHSRLIVVLGTYFVLTFATLLAAILMLHNETLSILGCVAAMAVVASILVMIVTCSLTVSALSNTTVVAITLVWMALYGVGFLLSLLPSEYPSPDRALQSLPHVLRGTIDWHVISRIVSGALSISLLMGVVGIVGFARKDV
jgi:ABC-2 type transport system permease protein